MELKENMFFTITEKFIPNFSKAQTLRILQFNEKTVEIEMENARSRGAFPIDQFLGLIKNGSLILTKETSLRTELAEIESENPAS
ncbi:hypothetical protein [Bacillus suaedaesalsae]|uniref:Uncharacterized protein n=1 Tax=Bacillus suaedaesalsae TaxID=2810349 RepID=A0ABS2DLW5_9BACI|nr:hypothetical protein [Bacillus suaedaesalsae]MBM6619396.1 hypothetical protein [Bacillus suaedaesalsae]